MPDGPISGRIRSLRERLSERRVRRQSDELQDERARKERREAIQERVSPITDEIQGTREELGALVEETGISGAARQIRAAGGSLAEMAEDAGGSAGTSDRLQEELDSQRATPVGDPDGSFGTDDLYQTPDEVESAYGLMGGVEVEGGEIDVDTDEDDYPGFNASAGELEEFYS